MSKKEAFMEEKIKNIMQEYLKNVEDGVMFKQYSLF